MLQYAPYSIVSKKSLGLPSHKAVKKPLLIQQKSSAWHLQKQYIYWTPMLLKKVMFSHESNFQMFQMVSPLFDTLISQIDLITDTQSQLFKHLNSVMVWPAVSGAMGRAGLYF